MLHSPHCTDTEVQTAWICILPKLDWLTTLTGKEEELRELCLAQGFVFERTHCPHTAEPGPVGLLHTTWK